MRHALFFIGSFFSLTSCFATETSTTPIPDSSPAFPTEPTPTPTSQVGYQPEAVTTQPKGTITPTVAPRTKNGDNICVDIDFIWWKSQVSNFDSAQINQKTFTPPFQFEPGFKVGTGMDLLHDGWDVYSEFTFLYQPTTSHTANNLSSGRPALIIPDSQGALSVMSLSSAKAARKYDFNILDIEAGRNFFISKRLTLRPHIGMKGASLFEKTWVTYTGSGIASYAKLNFKQNLSGIGTRAGIDTVWHITRDFGFYGDTAFTALWSSFHNNLAENITLESGTEKRSIHKKTQDILPVFEIGIGLTYMAWFYKDHYQLYLKAGWEEQIWLSYNKNIVNGLTSSDGSLTMQGLTLKAGFVF